MPESVKVESKTNKEVRSGKEEDKNELVSSIFKILKNYFKIYNFMYINIYIKIWKIVFICVINVNNINKILINKK